ncbi:MAG: transcription initiation factor IIB [Methanophagales archaeon]|nr:transcription initiation factor IIB [Methanophagales archaeon]
MTPKKDTDEGNANADYGDAIRECPECCSKNLIRDYEKAELFCKECGLIVAENIIDLGPEWRAFDSDQNSRRTRVGAPMTYRIHDKGLSTQVTGSLTGRGQQKLKKWQQRIQIANASEKSFVFALSEIERMASVLKLPPNIREAASMLYRKAMKKDLIRGRSIESIAAAVLYISCRQYCVPRTMAEIGDISQVRVKEIRRTYRYLLRELDLKVIPVSPVDFVPRFCSLLDLNGAIQSRAIEILKRATEDELTSGRGPIGLAAAAIYIAAILSGEHRTQKKVSDATGVTEVTIRTRYKELSEHLCIEVLR